MFGKLTELKELLFAAIQNSAIFRRYGWPPQPITMCLANWQNSRVVLLQPFRTLLPSVDVSDLHAPHDALGYPKRLLSSLNLWTLSRKKSSTWMPFKASHIVLKSEFFFLSQLPHEISSLFALLGHADGEVMLPKDKFGHVSLVIQRGRFTVRLNSSLMHWHVCCYNAFPYMIQCWLTVFDSSLV